MSMACNRVCVRVFTCICGLYKNDLLVCESADHKVESGPSFFLPRKLFPFGFNLLQMMDYKGSRIILQASALKSFWR